MNHQTTASVTAVPDGSLSTGDRTLANHVDDSSPGLPGTATSGNGVKTTASGNGVSSARSAARAASAVGAAATANGSATANGTPTATTPTANGTPAATPTPPPARHGATVLPDLPMAVTGELASPMLQLLRPDGVRVTTAETAQYRDRAAALTPDRLRGLHRQMTLARRFDEEGTLLQRQGELALFVQAKGQEGAQAGSAAAFADQDYIVPSYREHLVVNSRGVDYIDILRLFRGVDHGGWDTEAHKMHLYTLVIGAQTLHATGYAMGIQHDGLVGTGDPDRDEAVVLYFGDGATSQGDVNEALNFAAVSGAPIVFFCQNNQWAISENNSRQTHAPLYKRGEGFGIPSLRVDGNDVLACYAATVQALDRAHCGGGPTFIEAFTYRMGAHTTSDDPTRYRSREQEAYWADRDPIARLEALLRAEGEWDEAFAATVAEEAERLGERVRDEGRALGQPPASSMFAHVYATEHAQVSADRDWLAQYEADLAGEGAR